MTLTSERITLCLIMAALAIVAGGFVVSDGLFTIDEMIYFIAASAFAQSGGYAIANGFEQFGSNDLQMWFLVNGPNGLVPQYPPGTAILGAPLTAALGPRGLVLMNAIAAAGTLALTYRLAWRMHKDHIVAAGAAALLLVGSFFLEYAYGIWPHMLHTLFVLAAVSFAYEASDPDAKKPFLAALCAGILIGYAMLMRSDGILILPGIGVLVLLYAARPILVMAGGLLGLLPAVGFMALANLQKFGSLNPLSYGTTGGGGGSDPLTHFVALGPIALFFGLILAVRSGRLRQVTRAQGLAAFIGLIAIGFLIPQSRGLLQSYLTGFETLVLDMSTSIDKRPGVIDGPGGTKSFWGAPKKALAQSLPWLAIFALLIVRPWPQNGRAHALVLFSVSFWTLPFILLAWHGGFSNNMRYFLPLIPLLAISGAALWRDAVRGIEAPFRLLTLGLISGYALIQVWIMSGSTGVLGAHQILPQFAIVIVFLVALVVGSNAWPGETAKRSLHGVMAVSVGMAMAYGPLHDLPSSQKTRETIKRASASVSKIEGPALFYGGSVEFVSAFAYPDRIVGIASRTTGALDADLIENALDEGYRVYMSRPEGQRLLSEDDRFRATKFRWNYGFNELMEVVPATRPAVDSRLARQKSRR